MIEQFYDLRPEVLALDRKALSLCREQFAHVEEIRDYTQLKMLRAFTDSGVEARHFWGSSGYGVWDDSRNKLEEVFARCMGAEAALVRPQFMSGTHTLTVALFGLLRTGDTLLAATGRPYDTLEGVIGIGEAGKGCGTLREYGVRYDECPLLPDFTPDYDLIAEKAKTATVVHIQRSRGYTQRNAFDLDTIRKVADIARKANPNAVIFVDNCYGEFTQTAEPVAFGADIMAGSFIKNPGGGITPTGGYIAGSRDLVEKCSHRFTAPGIGGDLGCTQDSLRDTFLGFYYAPGVVCEALKTAIYAQCLLELAGVSPVPRYTADHNDIVTCFDSGSAAALPAPSPPMSRATPTRSSWPAAALPRAARSRSPAMARCARPTPAICRAASTLPPAAPPSSTPCRTRFSRGKVRRQSPSGHRWRSTTSPVRGGFCAGFAREKGAPRSGELAEFTRPEGLCHAA